MNRTFIAYFWLCATALPLACMTADATVTTVSWWRMGENDPGAGPGVMNATLDPAGGRTMTTTGAPFYNGSQIAPAAAAHTGSTLCMQVFAGTYGTAAVIPALTDNFGLECWVNPGDTSGGKVVAYNGNTGGSGWGLYQSGGTFLGLLGGVTFFGSSTAVAGTWTHLAIVRSGGVFTLYANGVAAGNTSMAPIAPAGNFLVGADNVQGNKFNGYVDEVRVFTFAPGAFRTNDLLLNRTGLNVTNRVEGPAAGQDAVWQTLGPGDFSYPISTTTGWLHPAQATGTGSSSVVFTFDANPGPTRTGVLTIGSQTLTVIQAGSTYQPADLVTTIAGSALNLPDSADGTNSTARFRSPAGVTVDAAGNLYVADTGNYTIRRVSPVGTNWVETTIAGSALNPPDSADGTNSTARFSSPAGVTVDAAGNLYVADQYNYTIRRVSPVGTNWVVTTIAGSAGVYGNADGTNSTASFRSPAGVTVDAAGNLYVADTGNYTIRQVSPVGTNWVVTTIAGSARVNGSADGTNSTARFDLPYSVTVDAAGNLYVADQYNHNIRRVSPVGTNWVVTTIAGSAGNLGSADGTNSTASFRSPAGVTVDAAGNLYVADQYNHNIRRVSPVGTNWVVTTIAGLAPILGSADGTNSTARFNTPEGVTVDAAGNLYVVDRGNLNIRRVSHYLFDATARLETGLAGSDALPPILPADTSLNSEFAPASDQSWLTITSTANGVVRFSYNANPDNAPRVAHISLLGQTVIIRQFPAFTPVPAFTLGTGSLVAGPAAGTNSVVLAADAATHAWTATANAGWLHVLTGSGSGSTNVLFTLDANPGGSRTKTLTIAGQTLTVTQAGASYVAAGQLTELAGLYFQTYSGVAGGLAVDAAGNVYAPDGDAGGLLEWSPGATINTFYRLLHPDGTYISPSSVALDAAGNIIILDVNHGAIEKWDPASGNSVVAVLVSSGIGLANTPGSWAQIAVDAAGNVYLADSPNNAIEEYVAASGAWVTNVTGLNQPAGVAVDAAGNLYIADTGNNRILAWNSGTGLGIVPVTGLNQPLAVAVDGSGNVYIADTGNNALKKWTVANGRVSTLAAGLISPNGVAVDQLGNVYVSQASISQTTISPAFELPQAYVDPTPRVESATAGSDALPTVLPAGESLLYPFSPRLIDGDHWINPLPHGEGLDPATNGVVSFSYAANPLSVSRTDDIILLGETVPIIQPSPAALPLSLTNPGLTGGGAFQFGFTNNPGAGFTVWYTTNLALPFTDWINLGAPSNSGPGLYQFTDPQTSNGPQRFYQVTSP